MLRHVKLNIKKYKNKNRNKSFAAEEGLTLIRTTEFTLKLDSVTTYV